MSKITKAKVEHQEFRLVAVMALGKRNEMRVSWPVRDQAEGGRKMHDLLPSMEAGQEIELQRHNGDDWQKVAAFRRIV